MIQMYSIVLRGVFIHFVKVEFILQLCITNIKTTTTTTTTTTTSEWSPVISSLPHVAHGPPLENPCCEQRITSDSDRLQQNHSQWTRTRLISEVYKHFNLSTMWDKQAVPSGHRCCTNAVQVLSVCRLTGGRKTQR